MLTKNKLKKECIKFGEQLAEVTILVLICFFFTSFLWYRDFFLVTFVSLFVAIIADILLHPSEGFESAFLASIRLGIIAIVYVVICTAVHLISWFVYGNFRLELLPIALTAFFSITITDIFFYFTDR